MERKSVIIVIPEVVREPKFDLIDPKTKEERPLTLEELADIADYENRLSNYTDIAIILDTWPVNGDWDRVIDDKGPIHIKDGDRYHIYCLDADRIERQDKASFISKQDTDFTSSLADIKLGHITKGTIKEWLTENNYKKLEALEI